MVAIDDESMINGGQRFFVQGRGLALIYTAWQRVDLNGFQLYEILTCSDFASRTRLPGFLIWSPGSAGLNRKRSSLERSLPANFTQLEGLLFLFSILIALMAATINSILGPEFECPYVADAVSPHFTLTRGRPPPPGWPSLCLRYFFSYGTVSGDLIPDSSQSLSHNIPFVPDRDTTTAPHIFSLEALPDLASTTENSNSSFTRSLYPGIILTCSILPLFLPTLLHPLNGTLQLRPRSALGISDESAELFKGMNHPRTFSLPLFSSPYASEDEISRA